jgi:hypothetical protein
MRILLTVERNLKYNLITSTSELLHRCYLDGIDSDQPREDLAWIAGMGKFEQVAVRLSLGCFLYPRHGQGVSFAARGRASDRAVAK